MDDKVFCHPYSPIHTSPNCPAPSFFTIFMDSLGISQASLSHGFWALGFAHGRSSLRHRPSALSVKYAGKKKSSNKLLFEYKNIKNYEWVLTVIMFDHAANVLEGNLWRDIEAAIIQLPDLIVFDNIWPLVVRVSDGQWETSWWNIHIYR